MADVQADKVSLPQRSSKYGVGKEIAGKIYVHRSYAHKFGTAVTKAERSLPDDFNYAVIKYDSRSEVVSFIACPDFDTNEEPTVSDVVTVHPDGTTRHRSQLADPQIYHHKWLFVMDDYQGFDTEVSKLRSSEWLALAEVDKSRIGKRSYWEQKVVPRLCQSAGGTSIETPKGMN